MNKWRPIDEYNAMNKKPKNCVFYFEETKDKKLTETIQMSRTFGIRNCTRFFVLPELD